MWNLDTKYNEEETIGTAHEKRDNDVERMTEEDWDRWSDNEKRKNGSICTGDRGIYTGRI